MSRAALRHHRFGAGKPLILLHGFLGGSVAWLPVMSELARFFDVIAPDLPGFGDSADLSPPDSIPGFSEYLISFMTALDVDRCAIVGHSLGGEIALQAALDHPQRFERLVLYGSPSSGRLPDRFETPEQTIARIDSQGADAAADQVVRSWFRSGADSPHYAAVRAASRDVRASTMISTIRAIVQWDVEARLGELRMPVLVIGGQLDRSVSAAQALTLSEAIPGAQFAVIPGCAHNAHLERSGLFNAIVGDFLLGSR